MADIIIIGAGLSGLTAANYLHQKGRSVLVLEAAGRPGGRVQTTEQDGFLLDHGFQVLATAYPEARALLDYSALDLRPFKPGALLLQPDGSRGRIGDPIRDPGSLFPTLFAKAGGLSSKLGILRLRNQLARLSAEEVFQREERPTAEVLRGEYGFSEELAARFFRPFYAGIFLEPELRTSRRMFDFVFKMFAEGAVAVPNGGMGQIPLQLAGRLPEGSIRYNSRVAHIEGQHVHLESGAVLSAGKIILATEATGLVKDYAPAVNTRFVSTTHLHFRAAEAPLRSPLIALNTRPTDRVNSLTVMDQVAPGYAPAGQHLLSVAMVGQQMGTDGELFAQAQQELSRWFGQAAAGWQPLHLRRVKYALPAQEHVQGQASYKIRDGLYVIGDHLLHGSINGAMQSGREVAEQL